MKWLLVYGVLVIVAFLALAIYRDAGETLCQPVFGPIKLCDRFEHYAPHGLQGAI